MITFEQFKRQIDSIKEFIKICDDLNDNLNIYLYESPLYEITMRIFDNFIESIFTEEGCDLFYWWMYEEVPKVIYVKEIFGETEINIEDIKDFWSYLIGHKEEYFK